jgi:hypothetical protein
MQDFFVSKEFPIREIIGLPFEKFALWGIFFISLPFFLGVEGGGISISAARRIMH